MMPCLSSRKRILAAKTNSSALKADAVQSSMCTYLAWIALGGLLVNAVFRFSWADSMAALLLLPIVLKVGWDAMHGNLVMIVLSSDRRTHGALTKIESTDSCQSEKAGIGRVQFIFLPQCNKRWQTFNWSAAAGDQLCVQLVERVPGGHRPWLQILGSD